ncbi:uncharacterized protein LOC129939964 isoform X2 [Eupeodes corollae]|uniref:uncharacterized protein LOC129939964 isoform X2 n=1 Tax=Eupeodes corollae TaxID=290404 RepID=UPI00248FA795|nr:uncharacterized protein LOC129939964 isoform X2 [Eupeodes corollae]
MEKQNIEKQNMSINKKQIEILTNFMSVHFDLARGILKTAQGRKDSNMLWGKVTESLNTEGPPQKDLKDWKKVKNKLRSNKLHLKGTGGGPYIQKTIDDLEEKIIECAGLEAAVDGVPTAKSFGVGQNNSDRNIKTKSPDIWEDIVLDYANENNIDEEELYVEDVDNSTKKRTYRHKKEKENEKENLMKQYVTATVTINTKLDKIHETLCSTLKVEKRRLDLEEKQYKLKKRKFEMYEKNQHQKLRLQEAMLTTKIEENRIRLQEVETRKF